MEYPNEIEFVDYKSSTFELKSLQPERKVAKHMDMIRTFA